MAEIQALDALYALRLSELRGKSTLERLSEELGRHYKTKGFSVANLKRLRNVEASENETGRLRKQQVVDAWDQLQLGQEVGRAAMTPAALAAIIEALPDRRRYVVDQFMELIPKLQFAPDTGPCGDALIEVLVRHLADAISALRSYGSAAIDLRHIEPYDLWIDLFGLAEPGSTISLISANDPLNWWTSARAARYSAEIARLGRERSYEISRLFFYPDQYRSDDVDKLVSLVSGQVHDGLHVHVGRATQFGVQNDEFSVARGKTSVIGFESRPGGLLEAHTQIICDKSRAGTLQERFDGLFRATKPGCVTEAGQLVQCRL